MNAVGYYTEKYNISSVGRTYTGSMTPEDHDDLPFGPRQKTLVNIVHYFDGRQDPYGKTTTSGSSPAEIRPRTFAAQQRIRGDGLGRRFGARRHRRSSSRTSSCRRTTSTRCGSATRRSTNGSRSATRRFLRATTTRFFLRFDDVVVFDPLPLCYGYRRQAGYSAASHRHRRHAGLHPGNAMRITTDLSTGTPQVDPRYRGDVVAGRRRHHHRRNVPALRGKVINAASTVTDDGSRISVGHLARRRASGNLVRKVFPQAVQANPTSPDNKEYWGFEQTATVGGVKPRTSSSRSTARTLRRPFSEIQPVNRSDDEEISHILPMLGMLLTAACSDSDEVNGSLPSVTTLDASEITRSTAVLNGETGAPWVTCSPGRLFLDLRDGRFRGQQGLRTARQRPLLGENPSSRP